MTMSEIAKQNQANQNQVSQNPASPRTQGKQKKTKSPDFVLFSFYSLFSVVTFQLPRCVFSTSMFVLMGTAPALRDAINSQGAALTYWVQLHWRLWRYACSA